MSESLTCEVKYTIKFNDGRKEIEQRFPFPVNDPLDNRAFKMIAEREPDLKEAESLFIRTQTIIPPQGQDNTRSLWVTGDQIRSLLNQIKNRQ
jgi:hypothetical protein